MKLLDGFAGEGGAAEGYRRAGFDVTCVDIAAMPANPHRFVQADALEYMEAHLHEFDVAHVSPPCQLWSVGTKAWNGQREHHVDLVTPAREILERWGGPYVIENVPGAPLRNPVQLCGSSFGLAVRRHRLFESNVPIMALPCAHHLQREAKYPPTRSDRSRLATVVSVFGAGGGRGKDAGLWATAMGIDWMSKHGLAQAIPPAYTEHIGQYLMAAVPA